MRILIGGDLGFSSIGITVCSYADCIITPLLLNVIRTKKSKIGSVSEDNFRRSRYIHKELSKIVKTYNKYPITIFVESMAHTRDASVAGKVSQCWGVLASIAEDNNLIVIQNSPQKIKKELFGKTSASKEEVEQALRNIFTDTDFDAMLKLNKVPKGLYEHAFDALGAMVVGLLSEGIDIRNKKDEQ